MINNDKWISSLVSKKSLNEDNEINSDRWVNSISKKKNFNSVGKYSFVGIIFVFGLLLVSAVKNETRNLQKEINNLQASINLLKFNVDQAVLDNEVITSPENISLLAKEYLNSNLTPYKVSQIKKLDNKDDGLFQSKEKTKKLSVNIKTQVAQKIIQKKNEIKKLKELYSDPKAIPGELKTEVTKQIKEKKIKLKKIYKSPKEYLTLDRVQKWGAVQVVKVFLGIPVVPGR